MIKILKWIPDHLLWLVLIVGTLSLFFPQPGSYFGWMVAPVLTIMMLNVSMTIKAEDLSQIVKHPGMIILSAFLQFVPMTLFSSLLGKMFFQSGDINTGQLLLGSLPGDISAPLMVCLAGGSAALATAMLIVAMVFTPFVMPNALSWLGHMSFHTPTSYLIMELAGIILLPVIVGVLLNSCSKKVRENEQMWSGMASLCYVMLLCIVVSSNAKAIIDFKSFAFHILFVEILLNFFGYGLAYTTIHIFKQRESYLPLLFLTSSKEFGIASAAAKIMNLNNSIVIPSAFYAVVQMISSPIMVKIMKKSLKKIRINAG